MGAVLLVLRLVIKSARSLSGEEGLFFHCFAFVTSGDARASWRVYSFTRRGRIKTPPWRSAECVCLSCGGHCRPPASGPIPKASKWFCEKGRGGWSSALPNTKLVIASRGCSRDWRCALATARRSEALRLLQERIKGSARNGVKDLWLSWSLMCC